MYFQVLYTVVLSISHPRGANRGKALYDYLLYMVIANETTNSQHWKIARQSPQDDYSDRTLCYIIMR